MVGGSWYGLLPKGTPPEGRGRALYKATKVALSGEDVRRAMEERDVIIEGSTRPVRTYLLAEFKRWQGVTEKLGIKPQ